MVAGLLALLFYVMSQSGQLAGFSPGINLEPTLIRQEDRTAPDFVLTLSDGSEVRLSDLRGKAVVINFWASWCAPCRAEAPTLEETYKRYADRDVVILGITLWDTEEAAAEFRKVYGQTYPSGIDPNGKIAIEYGVSGIPETYFIAPDGKIIAKFVGPLPRETMESLLTELLGDA
jgi:cytochrome c biogenesis protein CcmG/thiol:disulfide interchange protein DsbE